MEIHGNIESIKDTIEKKYLNMMDEIEKKRRQELAKIEKAKQDKMALLKEEYAEKTEAEAKVARARIMNTGKMAAKAKFENAREEMYERVFSEVLKKAKEQVHSKKYIDFVKKQLPKGLKLQAYGDSTYYKTAFKNVKTNKSITGLRFEAEELIFDFTIDAMLEAKRDNLRNLISDCIFTGSVQKTEEKPASKKKSTQKITKKKTVKKTVKKKK